MHIVRNLTAIALLITPIANCRTAYLKTSTGIEVSASSFWTEPTFSLSKDESGALSLTYGSELGDAAALRAALLDVINLLVQRQPLPLSNPAPGG